MSIHDEMQTLYQAWVDSFSQGNIDACLDMYTEDSAIYSPYCAAANGKDAILGVHNGWLEEGETNKKIDVIEASGNGNLAYCVATYSGDFPQEDGSLVNESGVVLTVCKKQQDGNWKFHLLSLNSDTPPLANG